MNPLTGSGDPARHAKAKTLHPQVWSPELGHGIPDFVASVGRDRRLRKIRKLSNRELHPEPPDARHGDRNCSGGPSFGDIFQLRIAMLPANFHSLQGLRGSLDSGRVFERHTFSLEYLDQGLSYATYM